jgi:hypothetical protein
METKGPEDKSPDEVRDFWIAEHIQSGFQSRGLVAVEDYFREEVVLTSG